MSARGFLVCASMFGCASLPSLPPEQVAPRFAVPAPTRGSGQVVVDTVNGTGPRLAEITGTARIPWTTYALYGLGALGRNTVAIRKELCESLPCSVDVSNGPALLEVRDEDELERFRVVATEGTRVFVRVRLPEHRAPALAVLGWTIMGISVLPVVTGVALLAADVNEFAVPGGVTLAAGAVLAIFGAILAATHPVTSRPGSITSWVAPAIVPTLP